MDGEPEETCTRQVERFTNILIYRHLYHPILFIFKDAVGFLNFAQWETVRDEGCGVYPALFNQAEHLFAVAAVNAAGLEGEVFAIHIGKRKNLRLVIKGHHGNNCIRAGIFGNFRGSAAEIISNYI